MTALDISDHENRLIRHSVSFSTLTVREYPRLLGDNVTTLGPPISMDWHYEDENVYDLVEYDEASHEMRRTKSEMVLPSATRNDMLSACGFTKKEIQAAVKKSTIARNQRKRTIETLKFQPVQELMESMGKKNPLQRLRRNKSSNNYFLLDDNSLPTSSKSRPAHLSRRNTM